MIAILKQNQDFYYCSNCRMRTPIKPRCQFCGYEFSNYETVLLDNYDTIMQEEIKDEKDLHV